MLDVAVASERVALVIGNSDYRSTTRLQNPIRDATVLADALRRVGFDSVETLTDATQEGFRTALLEFGKKAEGSQLSLIYYAGHGLEVDGKNYLIPVDARISHVRDAVLEGIDLSLLRNAASGARLLRLVFVDACRNNPFKLSGAAATRSTARGLARVEAGSNEAVVFAAREGTVAVDGAAGGNSPFARSLALLIEQGDLEIGMLFRRLRDDVVRATDGAQEPFVYASLGGEQIFLSSRRIAVVPVAPPSNPREEGKATTDGWETAFIAEEAESHYAPSAAIPTTPCDELAGDPYDRDAVVHAATNDKQIDHTLAIAACRKAIAEFPGERRFDHQLGRALISAGRYSEAIISLRRAAAAGSVGAMASIGDLYWTGHAGPKSEAKAIQWYRAAASAGHVVAMHNLGGMLATGVGTDRDPIEGAKWLLAALRAGFPQTKDELTTRFSAWPVDVRAGSESP